MSFILFQGVGSGGDRWGRLGEGVALNLWAPFWGPWKFLDKLRGLWKFLDQLEGSGNFLRQSRHFYFNFIGQLRGLQDLLGPIWRPQNVLGQFGWLWKYSNPLWGSWNHLVCIAPPPPWTSINDTSFCSFIVQKFKTLIMFLLFVQNCFIEQRGNTWKVDFFPGGDGGGALTTF